MLQKYIGDLKKMVGNFLQAKNINYGTLVITYKIHDGEIARIESQVIERERE